MEVKLIPSKNNIYPLRGLIIRGNTIISCLHELKRLNISLSSVQLYPLPGVIVNSICGCVVLFGHDINKEQAGKHEMIQQVTPFLFIAERSTILPILSPAALDKLFHTHPHIFLPDVGLAELSDQLHLHDLFTAPASQRRNVTQPLPAASIPEHIRRFYVRSRTPEEVMQEMEAKAFPVTKSLEEKPLNLYEKLRLSLYKFFFQKKESDTGQKEIYNTPLGNKIKNLGKQNQWDRLEKDFDDLEARNQKAMEKLLSMLKNNPEDAIQYAIPLDDQQTNRGPQLEGGSIDLIKRWSSLTIFGKNSGRSGSVTLEGDHYHALQKQYFTTAEALIQKKEYEKAAFVYMKLLKQYAKAADTMALGKHYAEAASIHLKHTGDRRKAAEYYEKGNMTMEAIEQYGSLREYEKVGDLYTILHDRSEATKAYQQAADKLKSTKEFAKAAALYRHKLGDHNMAQSTLLEAWQTNTDAVNCLSQYFSSIPADQNFMEHMERINKNMVDVQNRESFLRVMQHQYKCVTDLQEPIRNMAFGVISQHATANPGIVSILKQFNPQNQELNKDTFRFGLKRKNKR